MSYLCMELCKTRQLGNDSARFPFHKQVIALRFVCVSCKYVHNKDICNILYLLYILYLKFQYQELFFFKIVTVVKD